MFDPYRKWLGIPEEHRPPTHYQLLGIATDERDLEVIDAAALRQSAYVRNFQAGKYGEHATRILNEIAAAKICLLDRSKRAAYDAELKRKAAAANPPRQTPPAGADTVVNTAITLKPPLRAAQAPPAAATRSLPPPIDLDALASQAGLAGRGRGSRVRLPSRQKQAMPAYYWQIPVAVGAALAMIIIGFAASRGSRGRNAEQEALIDPGAVETTPPGEPTERAIESNAASNDAATSQPAPGGFEAATNRAMNRTEDSSSAERIGPPVSAGELGQSEAESGSPEMFPGEADGGRSTVSLPLPARDPMIVFAPGTNPFVVVGQEVFNLNTGESVGKTGAYQARSRNALRALSPDGKFYASADETTALGIEVRSCETGEWLFSVPLERSFLKLTLLEIAGPGQLVSSARFGNGQWVRVSSLASGEAIKEFLVEPFERSKAALSDDGETLAVATNDGRILLYDVAGSVQQAKAKPSATIFLPPVDGVGATVDGLRFSPDGDELLAVLNGGARLACWNDAGETTFEQQPDATQTAGVDMRAVWTGACVYEGPAIEWHPGGRGWLLNGHFFFDRELRRVIWMLQTERDADARMRFVDAQRLMTLRNDGVARKLADIAIPWAKIDRTLLAVHSDEPSHLGPKQPISLEVRVGRVLPGSQAAEVGDEIEKILTARLGVENIRVAPDRPTRLRASYYEEPQSSFDAPGVKKSELKLELFVNPGAKEIWRANVISATSGAKSSSIAAERAELYWRLSTRLHQTPMPYFIPKSPELSSLPAIIRP